MARILSYVSKLHVVQSHAKSRRSALSIAEKCIESKYQAGFRKSAGLG